ncbi:restriction endonuclease subunit S [Pediococcus acidilactici]|uniref:restriction endonuclease subunit S n=1 Tax=Pediococcus acidilactici TaxID=1254 RepID=UPI00132570D3|nr:restriction endonuclease subunit S [Pediococcus acidilactici]KAF0333857.1 restriction endonuclease subunit S [Pediococcus acidilactici]KAF0343304.1 restriction endonuclease subunit S [Pediococcus acidilactici]KAF0425743.1 restriction endonuclease subunit S [Pediococcus acidilactici]KAF0430353.1 restriction endonuclease subunit S [Pediococcus acidilactici]KAF0449929.1 restriction endonuclease subunit S [Pediococcus acidilactici]
MNASQTKYPQLRFKGFTDPWEQRKTKELCDISTGKGNTQDKVEDGKYPFYVRSATIERSNEYLYDQEAVLTVGDGVGTGKVFHYVNGKYNLHQRVYRMFNFNHGVSAKYFYHYFSKNFYRRVMSMTAKTSVDSVRMEMIADMKIKFPSPAEQETIVSVLDGVDDLISLHQRKLAKLKKLKQGYLQKTFPKNGSKFPQLRFAGFADAWEQRKLSNLAERVTRKNKNNESGRPLTISAQDGLIDQNDFFDKQIASRDVSGYFLVKNGEFAYNKSYSNGYPWGAIKRLDKYDMGVLSTLYIIFRPTNVSSQFLVSYYDTTRWYKEVAKNAAEGARNHGLLNIAPTDFFSTVLIIPNSIEEQQKIGSFFKQLDDTITLQQRKLEKLQELKKGYLQKMFC